MRMRVFALMLAAAAAALAASGAIAPEKVRIYTGVSGSDDYVWGTTGPQLPTDAWQQHSLMPQMMMDLCCASNGTDVYVVSGYPAGAPGLFKHAVGGTSWTTLAPPPLQISNGGGAIVGDTLYYCSGYDLVGAVPVDTLQKYCISTNTWTTAPGPFTGTTYNWQPLVIALGGKVYYISGCNQPGATAPTREVYAYTPGAGWARVADMNTGSVFAAGWVHGGRIYVAGGADENPITRTEFYDPGADVWTIDNVAFPQLPYAVWGAGSGIVGNTGFIASGVDITWGLTDSVMLFDHATHAWTVEDPVFLRVYRTCAWGNPDGKAVVYGGSTGGFSPTNVCQYDMLPVGGGLSPDSLYFKSYTGTALMAAAKSANPAPVNRTTMAFQHPQSVPCMDAAGEYVYEVYNGNLRRFSTATGAHTDHATGVSTGHVCGTDGSFVYAPNGSQVHKLTMGGTLANTTTLDITCDPFSFAVVNDTVWASPDRYGEVFYAYPVSAFNGGSASHVAQWAVGPGTSGTGNIAWDGTHYYVTWVGTNPITFKRFTRNRTLLDSGQVSIDPRSVMCVAGPPSGVFRVLWLYSDYQQPDTTLGWRLTALGDSVEYRDVRTSTPALGDLLPYDAVGANSNYGFSDPVALGNVLADYVDAGGGVVLANFCFTNDGNGMGGRVVTGDYATLTQGSNAFATSTLGWNNPAHPVMAGVATVGSYFRTTCAYLAPAESVANWADGRPYVAVSANQKVVGLNQYPGIYPSPNRTGDWALVIHNALRYAAGHMTGTEEFDPLAPAMNVTLAAGPNPTSSQARISYAAPGAASVDVAVYDASGRLVRTLVSGGTGSDVRQVTWNLDDARGRRVPHGVYFCKLVAGKRSLSRKLVVH